MTSPPRGLPFLASAGLAAVLLMCAGCGSSLPDNQAKLVRSTETGTAGPVRSAAPAVQTPGKTATLTAKPKPRHKPKAKPKAQQPAAAPEPPPSLDFVISSFNVLGSSHTSSGGTRSRWASGRTRARSAAALLARHGVDVVGFQELQGPQLSELLRVAGGRYDVYPGFSMRRLDSENSIAWRRDMWERVSASTIPIPYFDGHRRDMPVVLLQNRATGLRAYFANFHNPASTGRFPNQQRWRDRATAAEIAMANRLLPSGVPLFITGDMNEREEYFCRLTGSTPMIAAHGGSNNGGCQPPQARAVDWIFGSPDVTFGDYTEDRSPLVARTTDHPMIVSRVRIQGESPAVSEAKKALAKARH